MVNASYTFASALLAMASGLYVAFKHFHSPVQDGPFSSDISAEDSLVDRVDVVMESLE